MTLVYKIEVSICNYDASLFHSLKPNKLIAVFFMKLIIIEKCINLFELQKVYHIVSIIQFILTE